MMSSLLQMLGSCDKEKKNKKLEVEHVTFTDFGPYLIDNIH